MIQIDNISNSSNVIISQTMTDRVKIIIPIKNELTYGLSIGKFTFDHDIFKRSRSCTPDLLKTVHKILKMGL